MQDIPRNELLDKLAAGWKCQRKKYSMPSPALEIGLVRLSDLLSDDWEGEPPEPVLLCNSADIVHAFEELRDCARFIRRKSWPRVTILLKNDDEKRLTIDDILANDWEVWG